MSSEVCMDFQCLNLDVLFLFTVHCSKIMEWPCQKAKSLTSLPCAQEGEGASCKWAQVMSTVITLASYRNSLSHFSCWERRINLSHKILLVVWDAVRKALSTVDDFKRPINSSVWFAMCDKESVRSQGFFCMESDNCVVASVPVLMTRTCGEISEVLSKG